VSDKDLDRPSLIFRVLRGLARVLVTCIIFAGVVVALQDFLIFPGWVVKISSSVRSGESLPQGVESIFIHTSDNEKLELWYLPPQNPSSTRKEVAIIFHGNGGNVDAFFSYQRWLSELGISSYGFDYRGYGNSTGWPTEKGIYLDGEAVWAYIKKRHNILAKDRIIVGTSLGVGPAAYLNAQESSGVLVMFSPFFDLPAVIRETPPYQMLASFVRHKFPVAKYVSESSSTCIVAAHGKRDTIIPFSNLALVEKAYKGDKGFTKIINDKAGHNNLFWKVQKKVGQALLRCLDP